MCLFISGGNKFSKSVKTPDSSSKACRTAYANAKRSLMLIILLRWSACEGSGRVIQIRRVRFLIVFVMALMCLRPSQNALKEVAILDSESEWYYSGRQEGGQARYSIVEGRWLELLGILWLDTESAQL
jgi:hypothetical protein